MSSQNEINIDVSIIMPMYNSEQFLEEALNSVLNQQTELSLEIVIVDDCSTDSSKSLARSFEKLFERKSIVFTLIANEENSGVGFSKNLAVSYSSGKFLCFFDSDDVMMPDRVQLQYEAAQTHLNAIVGGGFTRIPEDSTPRYTRWANNLTNAQLNSQFYTSHGPTIIMPTWFMRRAVFDRVGGFDTSGKGTPEDLIFFLKHVDERAESSNKSILEESNAATLSSEGDIKISKTDTNTETENNRTQLEEPENDAEKSISASLSAKQSDESHLKIVRVDRPLIQYRYHQSAVTHSISELTIWRIRMDAIQANVLANWRTFSIWNAGKQGRKFYRSLTRENRAKVQCFCDVDEFKISKGVYVFELSKDGTADKPRIPIVHYRKMRPPVVICVKQDLTNGELEANLEELELEEAKHFVWFS